MSNRDAVNFVRAGKPKPPTVLDAIADVVLRYRPTPKSEPAKQRRKKRRRIEKEEKKDG